MQGKINDHVLEGFNTYFSRLFNNIEKIESSGPRSIIVTGDGGSRVEYHDGLHSIKWLRSDEDVDVSEETWRTEFKYRLNKKMSEAGLNVEGLSDRTGISKVTIYRYLNKKATPSCWIVRRMAKALGCDARDLI